MPTTVRSATAFARSEPESLTDATILGKAKAAGIPRRRRSAPSGLLARLPHEDLGVDRGFLGGDQLRGIDAPLVAAIEGAGEPEHGDGLRQAPGRAEFTHE